MLKPRQALTSFACASFVFDVLLPESHTGLQTVSPVITINYILENNSKYDSWRSKMINVNHGETRVMSLMAFFLGQNLQACQVDDIKRPELMGF